nr:9217_t:CDS:2 [Entrophospora candida]CAG8566843.1 6593_t:CDS:2 [Entrophospora candida]
MSETLSKVDQIVNDIKKTATISNEEKTRKKLNKIIKDGFDNLHVISDFDATMTSYWTDNKKRNPGSHSVLGSSKHLSDQFRTRTKELYEKYYSIEIDSHKSRQEKIPYMVEWWEKAHELLINEKINKDDLAKMAAESTIKMRPGLASLINTCNEKKVPLLIFSAGLGNVIEQVLRIKNLYYQDTMHIVSNQMEFNPVTGICNHFKEPLIHVFNKSEVVVKDSPYRTAIEERRNVILLGDSIGDLQMSYGISHDTSLTIGFLNFKIDELLDEYLKSFDIVVTDDGPMDCVNIILSNIDNCFF